MKFLQRQDPSDRVVEKLLYILILALIIWPSGCSISGGNKIAQEDAVALQELRALGPLDTTLGTSSLLATTANNLRKLGKSRAISVMKRYLAEKQTILAEENVQILCKLLFNIPVDKQVDFVGQVFPAVDDAARKLFPDFPVTVVDGVPFMLIKGSTLGGWVPDLGKISIQTCESLPLRENAYDLANTQNASEKLIASPEFNALYLRDQDRSERINFIRDQVKQRGEKRGQEP